MRTLEYLVSDLVRTGKVKKKAFWDGFMKESL